MRNLLITLVVALAACGNTTPSGDITAVNTPAGGGLTGGSNVGSANLTLLTSCSSTQILKWNGSAWACSTDATGGSSPSVQTSSSTGTLNDFALSAGTTLLRFTSASTTTLTGLARGGGNVDGDCVDLQYEGSSTFSLGSSGGTASNNFRFSNGVTTYVLGAANANTSRTVRACYSTTTSRWSVTGESVQCAANQVAQVDGSGNVTCLAVGDITGVTAGTGLTGGGTSGTPTLTLNMTAQSCSAGSFLSAATAVGVFTCTAEPGDISGVTANSPLSGGGTTGALTIGMANGDRGDITTTTGTQTGDTWTIDPQAVTFAKMANVSTSTITGRITAGTGSMESLTGTQATSLLDTFSTSTTTKGLVPGSNGASTSCLLGNGTWGACGVTGSGTTDTIPIFTAAGVIGDSTITKSGSTYTVSGTVNTSGTLTGGTGVFNGAFDAGISSYGLAFKLATNATADGIINGVGYNEGTTQFRNLRVQDGKGADVFVVTGSTKGVAFVGPVSLNGTSNTGTDLTLSSTFVANGSSNTVGDADSDFLNSRATFAVSGTDVSTASANCTASGEAQSFTFSRSSGATGSCTIDFNRTFNSAPYCVVSNSSNKLPTVYVSAVTTTSVTITSSDSIDAYVWCPDRR